MKKFLESSASALGVFCLEASSSAIARDFPRERLRPPRLNWPKPLADQGDAQAQYNLGVMYGNGQGVPQDYFEAYKWLSLDAAAHDDAVPSKALDAIALKMTSAQIAQAQQLSR